ICPLGQEKRAGVRAHTHTTQSIEPPALCLMLLGQEFFALHHLKQPAAACRELSREFTNGETDATRQNSCMRARRDSTTPCIFPSIPQAHFDEVSFLCNQDAQRHLLTRVTCSARITRNFDFTEFQSY